MLRSFFLGLPGVLNKDHTVWLNVARPSPKYVIAQSNNTLGSLAIFCRGIHPMYMVDLSTYYLSDSFIRGIVHPIL